MSQYLTMISETSWNGGSRSPTLASEENVMTVNLG